MVMTSVSGHLLALEFLAQYRNWKSFDPIKLFEAPVRKYCPPDFLKIKSTLEREVSYRFVCILFEIMILITIRFAAVTD